MRLLQALIVATLVGVLALIWFVSSSTQGIVDVIEGRIDEAMREVEVQTRTTSWKCKVGGVNVDDEVTTTREAGESNEDWNIRHNASVAEAMTACD